MSQNVAKMDLLTNLTIVVIVAALYALTGYLGLFLAAPPGYATAIWIPSGIALGAVLVWGLRILPGIFLGSFITNFFITTKFGINIIVFLPLVVAILIAIGATLQALIGWLLIKKTIGLNNKLTYPNDILVFVFLTGPVSCLINTTWSNTGLFLLHILPLKNYLLSWVTWWVGDNMGVLIFTPIFLILFAQPRIAWRPRALPILLPLCISFVIVLLTFFSVHEIEFKHIRSNFTATVENSLLRLENQLLVKNSELQNIYQDIDTLIKQDFQNLNDFNSISILDITNPKQISTIYSYHNDQLLPNIENYKIAFQKQMEIGNKIWLVRGFPSITYVTENFSFILWVILFLGLLFCAMINVILFIIWGQKHLAELKSDEKNSALLNAKSRNLLILEAAGEGIYGIDINGLATFVNPAAEKMLGYDESELIGKSMHEIIHHSHPDNTPYAITDCPIYAAFRYNKAHQVDKEVFWNKNGVPFWVEYTSTPIRENGQVNGAVVVFDDISERHHFELELQKMAHYDTLTSLPNRYSFFTHLNTLFTTIKTNKNIIAVCFIDLDNFKQINDTLGHTIGDEALIVIAKSLTKVLNGKGYLARLGGDEFGVIFEEINSISEISSILDKTIDFVSKSISIKGILINISFSIGVAIYPVAGKSPEELIMNADIAMYHAKESGKSTYAFFDEEINQKVKRRNQIDLQLRSALAKNEFSLDYQLQIDAQHGEVIGLETLLRWHNAELGDISPSEFISIAENNGLILHIGEWVLRKACVDYQKIIEVNRNKLLVLSVNISVVQLENSNFMKILENVLKETEMPSEHLILEITETAFMKNPVRTLKLMSRIKQLGIRFALDDFGVSYSSMQYLKNLPVSLIKIDQGFVRDMTSNHSDAKIVNAIIQLSHAIGIHALAEGVENKEQFQALKQLGCEYMQGYYFAKPMPLDMLLEHFPFEINISSDF